MEKDYYHAYGTIMPEGLRCVQCGTLLDGNLKAKTPCSTSMAATSVFEGFEFEVNVWNCSANLLVFHAERKEGSEKRKYFDLKIKDEKTERRLNELVEQAVYDVGGAINMSGIYPLSTKLETFIEKNFRTKLFFVERSK